MERIKINLPDNFIFRIEMPVRIYDINYGGHLGNDSILSFVHEARVAFLKKFGYSEIEIEGASMIMFDAAIQYKSQAFHGDILIVDVTIENFIKNGCDFIYKVTNKLTDKEIARAKTGIAFFNYKENKMVLVPEKFKKIVTDLNSKNSQV